MEALLSLSQLPPPAPRRLWVALSGGIDSIVLLDLLRRADTGELRAIHVNHGLQAAAAGWERRLRVHCRALGVPLCVRRVRIDPTDPFGPEAAARAARYAVFQSMLRSGDVLVTAHHRDDQAETVLLRILRGTGVAGLRGMPMLSALGHGRLWRPLLVHTRARIEAHARARGLVGVDDPHNRDPRYARSYLRHEILPRLDRHWPQARDSLLRLAGHAEDAEALLTELGQCDAAGLRSGDAWPVGALLALSAPRRRNLLRAIWSGQGWSAPSADLLQRLETELLRARSDAQPCLRFTGGEARRYRDRLYLCAPLPPPPGCQTLDWRRGRRLALPPGCGVLRLPRAPTIALEVRFASGGERLRPVGERHVRHFKQLCQRRGLPVWVRERLPLVYCDGALASIAGLWTSAEALPALSGLRWDVALPGLEATSDEAAH